MKLLYEAQNNIEAHMILNLLEQAGLNARIDGEYLQGGAGELQASGTARIMINEDLYSEAKIIIEQWDTAQPLKAPEVPDTKKNNWGQGFIGFIVGVTVMAVYFYTPVYYNGIDYNGDGTLDEKWTYVNDLITKTEIDRNFDGDMDIVYFYDRKGFVDKASADDDFNGSFETDLFYDHGSVVWQKSDTNGDNFKDYRADFTHGLLEKITFFNASTKKAIKIQQYGHFKLISAEIDTSNDGIMDTFITYDDIEEVTVNP